MPKNARPSSNVGHLTAARFSKNCPTASKNEPMDAKTGIPPTAPPYPVGMRRLVLLTGVLVVLLAIAWIVRPFSQDDVRDLVEPAGAWAPLVYVAVSGVLGALLFPGPLLAGASGLLFGTVAGFFATLAASVVTALIARWAGARAGREA